MILELRKRWFDGSWCSSRPENIVKKETQRQKQRAGEQLVSLFGTCVCFVEFF